MKKLSLDEAHYLSAAVLPYGLEVLQEYTETGLWSLQCLILYFISCKTNKQQQTNTKW